MSASSAITGLIHLARTPVAVLAGVGMMLIPGCGSEHQIQAPVEPAFVEPLSRPAMVPIRARTDHVVGRTLVMPVRLEGGLDPRSNVPLRLDDGRRISGRLVWISVAPAPASGPIQWTWLAPAAQWRAMPPAGSEPPTATGFWAMVADLPLDAYGQGLWLGGTRASINWLPDPGSLRSAGQLIPWPPILTADELAGPVFDAMVRAERTDPTRRWRYNLLARGLQPRQVFSTLTDEARPDAPPAPDLAPIADPVIEALARQIEDRWRIAMGWLWMADRNLALRLRRRLAAVVSFGQGVQAPCWPPDPDQTDRLLADLLDPRLSPTQRADLARTWIDEQPSAIGWVIDDAGRADAPTSRRIATLGVANLDRDPIIASARAVGDQESLEMIRVPPFSAHTVMAMGPDPGVRAEPGEPATIQIGAGSWSGRRQILTRAIPIRPPGATLGPFLHDWTMVAWESGASRAVVAAHPRWISGGRLMRSQDRPGWTLYLELLCPQDLIASPDFHERVRIWLGPFGSPRRTIEISTDLASQSPGEGPIAPGVGFVGIQDDRWICQVPISPDDLEPDGLVLLGIERFDTLGRRSAWPRPMLPWQGEPGRVAFDTTRW